jgi:hypothetical protein
MHASLTNTTYVWTSELSGFYPVAVSVWAPLSGNIPNRYDSGRALNSSVGVGEMDLDAPSSQDHD